MHDNDWTFTSMDTKLGIPTFYTWGLKSIYLSYNIHTCFPIIANSVAGELYLCNIFWTVRSRVK